MAHVVFTDNLKRHVACPPADVAGDTVRSVLDRVFGNNAAARGYVLDERGALRKHMNIFINGQPIKDREQLGDPLADRDEVYVMQALSGG